MLASLRAHLSPGGLCFLVVPRTCVERSSRTTPVAFDAVLARAGFRELERRDTPKLLHLCLETADAPSPRPAAPRGEASKPRRKKTNDFHITLPGDVPAPDESKRKRKRKRP